MSALAEPVELRTYEVELQHPSNPQTRLVSLEATDPAAARAHVEQQELDLTRFSLLPPDRETWEHPPNNHKDPDQPHATVDLSRWDAYHPDFAQYAAALPYGEAVSAATRRLADLQNRIQVGPTGKVRYANLNARHVARLMAHDQSEPYNVVDTREVDQDAVDAQRLVREIKSAIESNPRKWKLAIAKLREQGIPLNAVTAQLAGLPWQKQIDGSSVSVFSSAAVQYSLHTALSFNNDTMDFFDDVSATEITGTAYVAKGVTATSKASTYDTATDQVRLDTADPSWATSTLSATDSMVWVDTAGAASTDPVWGNIDFGATVTTTAGTFLITIDATGIVVFDLT